MNNITGELVTYLIKFQSIMADGSNVSGQLCSPSLRKQKFKIIKIKSVPHREDQFHYIFMSSDTAGRIVLIVNQAVIIFVKFNFNILNG